MLETAGLFLALIWEKMYTQYQKIINLILKVSDKEFTMQVVGSIRVLLKTKTEILCSVLFVFNLENCLFLVLLETSKLSYPNTKVIPRF